jgi:hypothetical protein
VAEVNTGHSLRQGTAVRTQIRHVRDALKREFDGLLDIGDLTTASEAAREQAFLSRALAALSRFQPHDSGPSSRVSTALASRPTR